MFRRLIALGVAFSFVCAGRPVMAEDKVDAASPKGVAGVFFKAMEAGDVKAAKAEATGSEKQLGMLDILVPMISSFKSLETAAVKKWGEEGRKALSEGRGGSMDFQGELVKSKEVIEGDSATITNPDKQEKEPMKLKKIEGKWKIDLSSIPAEGLDDPKTGKMINAMAKIAKETATDIDAGKFKTAVEAKEAMGQKMLPLLLGGIEQPPVEPKK